MHRLIGLVLLVLVVTAGCDPRQEWKSSPEHAHKDPKVNPHFSSMPPQHPAAKGQHASAKSQPRPPTGTETNSDEPRVPPNILPTYPGLKLPPLVPIYAERDPRGPCHALSVGARNSSIIPNEYFVSLTKDYTLEEHQQTLRSAGLQTDLQKLNIKWLGHIHAYFIAAEPEVLQRFVCKDGRVALVEHNDRLDMLNTGAPLQNAAAAPSGGKQGPKTMGSTAHANEHPHLAAAGKDNQHTTAGTAAYRVSDVSHGAASHTDPDKSSTPPSGGLAGTPCRPGDVAAPSNQCTNSGPAPAASQTIAMPRQEYKVRNMINQRWNVVMTSLGRKTSHTLPTNRDVLRHAGEGVRVYVLDSGINLNTAGLNKRVFMFKDEFTTKYVKAPAGGAFLNTDRGGHGTHVAGIIADKDHGVAPYASVVSVKVLCSDIEKQSGCEADTTKVLEALVAVVEEHRGWSLLAKHGLAGDWRGSVINMSLAGGGSRAYRDTLQLASQHGIPIAASAGNSGVRADPIFAPCAYDESVLCVGACDLAYRFAPYSNYGPSVKLIAPGTDIISNGITHSTSLARMTGTSMAAPAVAGGMAIIVGFEGVPSDARSVYQTLQRNAIPDAIRGTPRGSGTSKALFNTGIKNSARPQGWPYKK